MRRYSSAAIAILVSALLVLTARPSLAGASSPRARVTMEQLTVQITKASGLVWGRVSNSFNHQTCATTSCVYSIPKGTSVTLLETPTNAGSSPFTQWQLNGRNAGSAKTVAFKIGNAIVARALYVQKSLYSLLAGDWLGPAPNGTGMCGTEYAEWFLHQNGSFSYTQNSSDCGGFSLFGSYKVQNSTLFFHMEGCSFQCTLMDFLDPFSFVTVNALQICDPSAAGPINCHLYHRQ